MVIGHGQRRLCPLHDQLVTAGGRKPTTCALRPSRVKSLPCERIDALTLMWWVLLPPSTRTLRPVERKSFSRSWSTGYHLVGGAGRPLRCGQNLLGPLAGAGWINYVLKANLQWSSIILFQNEFKARDCQHIANKTSMVESAVWCCNSRPIYKFNTKQTANNSIASRVPYLSSCTTC